MAEAVVSCLLTRLQELLGEEAHFREGVRVHLESFQRELEHVQDILHDPDTEWRADNGKATAVRKIVELAHDFEDHIDTRSKKLRYDPSSPQASSQPKKSAAIPKSSKTAEDELRKFSDLLSKLKQQISNAKTVSNQNRSNVSEDRQILQCANSYDNSIVGLDRERKIILRELLSPVNHRCVVPIHGTGGLGKTALAESIYHSEKVKANFPIRAWLSVSQEYSTIELLKKLLRDTVAKAEDMIQDEPKDDIEALTGKLNEMLKQQKQDKYLVVVDDVWSQDVLRQILAALPDVDNGSRVILTTRLRDVAKSADNNVPLIFLKFLEDAESEDLIAKQVDPKAQGTQLRERLAQAQVRKVRREVCDGLPLALILLGGLLSTKTTGVTSEELEKVMTELKHLHEINKGKQCKGIFSLSYQKLPPQLKPCFLYMCSFPEYAQISAAKLIDLWIAEGFVPQVQQVTREDTARGYLNELIQRRMVKVTEWRYDGRVKKVQIHNLMRDFSIEEAASFGFLTVLSSVVDTTTLAPSNSVRRLAFHGCAQNRQTSHSDWLSRALKAHTLLGFNLSATDNHIPSFINEAKSLRVVDIEGSIDTWAASLPTEITKKVHLRYLRWNINHSINSVLFPSTVKDLQNLLTINVAPVIGGMGSDGSFEGVDKLKKLETLKAMRAGGSIQKDFAELINLRKLILHVTNVTIGSILASSLKQLPRLISLKLLHSKTAIPIDILTSFEGDHPLRSLGLKGPLQELPASSKFPPNLEKLVLEESGLEKDPMGILEKLPKLMVLSLQRCAYKGQQILCSNGGFPQLLRLSLDLPKLQEWELEERAMPRLDPYSSDLRIPEKVIPKRLQGAKKEGAKEVEGGWVDIAKEVTCPRESSTSTP